MEVHKILGRGFNEVVYKDALEYEFKHREIPYEREKGFIIPYKDIVLPRMYYADFVNYNKIILEVKASDEIIVAFRRQTLNFKLGIIGNFGEDSFTYQRLVL